MFGGDIIKYIVIGAVGLGTLGGGFAIMNLNGESATCNEAGYGSYDDNAGICEVNGKYASNLIIVAGNTANSPAPVINDKKSTVYQYLKNSVAKNANLKIVSAATGNASEKIELEANETNDAAGFVESVDQAINKINERISAAPNANGATYLEAISKAGRDVSSARSFMNQSDVNDDGAAIIVIGSGLSDGGILNFARNNLLEKGAEDVLSAMERAGELVNDLNGIKIVWSGIGQTTSPQKELSSAEIETLKQIYQQVLTRRGAVSVVFDDTMRDSKNIEGNKYTVKPTSVSDKEIYVFKDSELAFRADHADLVDEQSAKNTLSKVFEDAESDPSKKIIITGYMASGNCGKEANKPNLAKDRANTVKTFLQNNGVKNEITVVDGGVFEPEKSECDENHIWRPDLANYKRKVTIEFK